MREKHSYLLCPLTFCLSVLLVSQLGAAVRVKDVARVEGLTELQLSGFGLVIGLRNTGDGPRTQFTVKSVVNMLRNSGIEVPMERVRVRNVAAVMVSASFPPFVKKGSKIDISVSSIGDARSLEGGTLLMTPLAGADGKIYALGQGPVSIGGFNLETESGLTSVRKNHALVGEVPNGAIVQRERLDQSLPDDEIRFTLRIPDFTSAVQMTNAVNEFFKDQVAYAADAATIVIGVPVNYEGGLMDFLSELENITFEPSQTARVVLNEKTGTIVAGGDISISPVAISHGNITISIKSNQQTNTAVTASPGQTTTVAAGSQEEQATVEEEKPQMKVLPQVSNVKDLAAALNSLGVTPRDIISIFQSIKRAGALHAELVTM